MSSDQQTQQASISIMEEESTTFRSVPRGPSGMATGSLPSMPPLGLRSLGLPKQSVSLPSKPVSRAAASIRPSLNRVSWKVDATMIPLVPDYPLERTSLTCDAGMTCDQVTERIARVLEAQNLKCVCHDDDSADSSMRDEDVLPGRLDCSSETSDLMFVIQLWREPSTQQIVVEVQRRRGDAFEFSAVRKPLFRSLQSPTGAFTVPKKFSPPHFVPNEKLRTLPPSILGRAA